MVSIDLPADLKFRFFIKVSWVYPKILKAALVTLGSMPCVCYLEAFSLTRGKTY